MLVRGRTSGAGELCYVRDPGHTAIGRAEPAAGVILDRLTVERDFSVYIGGMQYQRAFGINGDSNLVRNCTLGGRVYGQRTPSQITGNVQVVGLEFHYGQQMIPASPDNVSRYPSRFNGDERPFFNDNADGKNRDAVGLLVTQWSWANGVVQRLIDADCKIPTIKESLLVGADPVDVH